MTEPLRRRWNPAKKSRAHWAFKPSMLISSALCISKSACKEDCWPLECLRVVSRYKIFSWALSYVIRASLLHYTQRHTKEVDWWLVWMPQLVNILPTKKNVGLDAKRGTNDWSLLGQCKDRLPFRELREENASHGLFIYKPPLSDQP